MHAHHREWVWADPAAIRSLLLVVPGHPSHQESAAHCPCRGTPVLQRNSRFPPDPDVAKRDMHRLAGSDSSRNVTRVNDEQSFLHSLFTRTVN
ncbi:hypothetical protein SAMN05880590_10553 [Rhizobium sp. RU35A]|nr:hypothetical protein SAMN05880590_10553 [Rhizobium sp. RU35A]